MQYVIVNELNNFFLESTGKTLNHSGTTTVMISSSRDILRAEKYPCIISASVNANYLNYLTKSNNNGEYEDNSHWIAMSLDDAAKLESI